MVFMISRLKTTINDKKGLLAKTKPHTLKEQQTSGWCSHKLNLCDAIKPSVH